MSLASAVAHPVMSDCLLSPAHDSAAGGGRRDRAEESESEAEQELSTRTLLDFLNREKLEGTESSTVAAGMSRSVSSSSSSSRSGDHHQQQQQQRSGLWCVLRQRLRMKGMACCGVVIDSPNSQDSSTSPLPIPIPSVEVQSSEVQSSENTVVEEVQTSHELVSPVPPQITTSRSPLAAGVNLETALAAERQLQQVTTTRYADDAQISDPGTPARVSLMRLMAEAGTDDGDIPKGVAVRGEKVCCVCMEREKGAAMIPCGHTFCRVCSRELWLNRGSCPLCNRFILEILDIF